MLFWASTVLYLSICRAGLLFSFCDQGIENASGVSFDFKLTRQGFDLASVLIRVLKAETDKLDIKKRKAETSSTMGASAGGRCSGNHLYS